ncbi:lipase family protein [Nocardia transvalensis]|uniref:lipase family protein n=1 Tax=Nocardia transvalensis TaxID=37333 RepID=UPI001893F466|nr:lipase family protein [Nocardia transvalensis]MBF6328969.1 lipase [Nocardia transvalensis]
MTVIGDVIEQVDSASGRAEATGTRRPLPPSKDPFLRPPTDLAARPPGTILRSRPVEVALLGLVPQQVSAWQLLYRSNDLHGRPEAAVTTVLLPAGADPAEQRPLLAFQSAIDAVTDRCAPSYALRRGAFAPGSITQLEWLLVANALRRGWAVSIADHEGRHGAFGAPREPGYRALDGIRAALRFEPLGLHSATPIAVWGYSGGGMASSWLVEMAPTYAPELDIVGAVLGAPVGDPLQVFIRLNGGRYAGFPAIVIAALRNVYPALTRVIDEDLTARGLRMVESAARLTPIVALARLANQNVADHLHRPLEEVLDEPGLRAMFDDMRLGGSTPACPLLVVQPVHDQIIHVDGIDGQVDRYRRGGAAVAYVRDRLSDHFSLLPLTTPLSLDWLADRIAGRPVTDTTTRTVWSVAAAPGSWRGLLEMIGTATRVALGRPLRQESEPVLRPARTLAA